MNLDTTRGEDLAITIDNRPAAYAGLVVTMFTLHGGKVSCLSTGIRRGNARLCGSVEPLTLIAARVAGVEPPTLRDARIIEDFASIKSDWRKTLSGLHMARGIASLTGPGDPQPKIFGILLNSLVQLARHHEAAAHTLFQLRLLKQTGHAPHLDSCANCLQPMPEPTYYDYVRGGTICGQCPPPQPWHGHQISPEDTRQLRMLDKGKTPEPCQGAAIIINRSIRWPANATSGGNL